jgi:S1-C subfamily serine protease
MQGDIITEVAQKPVTSVAEFQQLVEKNAESGKSLLVRFVRGNNNPDITIIRVPKE